MLLTSVMFLTANAASKPTPAEIRELAKQATIYGFPVVENYRVMYQQAINNTKSNDQFKAPFNTIASYAEAAGPSDTTIQTINADTPYSYLWLDLRKDGFILEIPKFNKDRYYSVQIIDLYTQNEDYIGINKDGYDGGKFLIVGPSWKGTVPSGIKRVIKTDTEFAYAAYRTQLFNEADVANVKKIQAQYKITPLSTYMNQKAPVTTPVNWPAIDRKSEEDPEKFFNYMNLMLQFMPVYPDEKNLRADFAKIGIDGKKTLDFSKMTTEEKNAYAAGYKDGMDAIVAYSKTDVPSSDIFGTHESLKNNYLNRAIGALLGLYGNTDTEAVYDAYKINPTTKQPYDASKTNYILKFAKGETPPVKAFWSLTMYDDKTLAMVRNPINRYLINSSMLKDLKTDKDGGVTIYIQKNSPGKDKESNWLPTPDGPFFMVLRMYLPDEKLLGGQWKLPELQPVK